MQLAVISRYPHATPKQPPLVFVHGAFTDARIWDANFLPYFATRGYAAHALSLRGHGLSEGRAQLHRWRLRDYVEDLGRMIADLPAAPVLIGHSMGGMVVQKYLETAPDIAGLALMASVSPRGILPSNLQMALRHPFLFQQMAIFSLFGPALGGPETMRRLLFSKDVPVALLRDSMRFMQAESQLVTWDLVGMDPLRLNPDQLRIPVLVQGAQQDVFISPDIVRQTARFYGSEAQILPAMAHAMMLDTHWRAAADTLLHWLDQVVSTRLATAA
jgi:pimeloyl-ACP methyl ester carboxylesterase